MTGRLAAFWHKVQRWCTNCFVSTLSDFLAIEACLPPLDFLLRYQKRLAALRVLCSPREITPATARLPPSVQTPSLQRHTPDYRVLTLSNAGSHLLLRWDQPRPLLNNCAHLPIDSLAHSMFFPQGPHCSSRLPVTFQHLMIDSFLGPPRGRSYHELKPRCNDLLLEELRECSPHPTGCPYQPSIRPHLFMGLNKFDAGGIHPMRSGKSYLRAHPSWNKVAPPICPRCDVQAPETFEHTILSSPAKKPARDPDLQSVSDLSPDAPVTSSAARLGTLP